MAGHKKKGKRCRIQVIDMSERVRRVTGFFVKAKDVAEMLEGALRDSRAARGRAEVFTFANRGGDLVSLPCDDLTEKFRSFANDAERGEACFTHSLNAALELVEKIEDGHALTLVVQGGYVGWSPSMVGLAIHAAPAAT